MLERCSDTTWLLMENTAGTGATIGRSVEELALLFDRLERHPRLGICLDSCHLYASGYDVTDEAALDSLLDEVDREIGLDRLRALHVNDSAAPLGSNRDRHANVGEGLMGKKLGVFLGQSAVAGPAGGARGPRPGRPRPGREPGEGDEEAPRPLGRKGQVLSGQAPRGPAAGLPPVSAYSRNPRVSVTESRRIWAKKRAPSRRSA